MVKRLYGVAASELQVPGGTAPSREQPLWMYGFGAGWGSTGWGVYEYPGWTVNDQVNYSEHHDHDDSSLVQTQQTFITGEDDDQLSNQQQQVSDDVHCMSKNGHELLCVVTLATVDQVNNYLFISLSHSQIKCR